MNKEKYIEILLRLRDADRRKRHENWRTNSWFLLHDDAPVGFDQEVLRKNEVTTLEHPPYSRDLASADFHLFPRLKLTLKG